MLSKVSLTLRGSEEPSRSTYDQDAANFFTGSFAGKTKALPSCANQNLTHLHQVDATERS